MNEIDQLSAAGSALAAVDSLQPAFQPFRAQPAVSHIDAPQPISDLRSAAADAVSAFEVRVRGVGSDRAGLGGEFLDRVRAGMVDLQSRGAALEARVRSLGSDPKTYLQLMSDSLQYQREAELFIQVVRALSSLIPQITQMQG